jgi:TonB-linked SusC/RagA family outer membrane protein
MYKIFTPLHGGCYSCVYKFLRIMKLIIILLTVFMLQLRAASMAQTVSLKADKVQLKELIIQLHQLTGYNFICNSEILENAKPVTVALKDVSIETAFQQCFSANALNYMINKEEGTVVLSKKTALDKVNVAPIIIKGTVTDDKGQTLPGVTVSVKGTARKTVTNNTGNFSVEVPDNQAVIVFSMVGFDSQEVKADAAQPINVVLKESNSRLDEVVVVGYGSQKRSDITSAVSSLSAKSIEERAVSRVDQALVGQIAGVTVKQTTGLPGKGFSIQVRGSGSISASSEPLYVVDGFPLAQSVQDATGGFGNGNALDNINPDDIESIEVLKDAAAAAIYGSRASNGVVLITTKKGKVGKAKIQFSSSAGYSQAVRKVDVLSGPEWIDRATEMINAAYVAAYGSKGAKVTDDNPTRIGIIGSNTVAYVPDARWSQPGYPGLQFVDWQDQILRKAPMLNNQVSASGGTNNVTYFFSVNNINQDGIVVGTSSNQYSARANVEANLNQKLKVGINLSPSYSVTEDPGLEGKDVIFHQALSMTPATEDTSGVHTNAFNKNVYNWGTQFNSPLDKALTQVGETKRYRTIASVYGIYNIIKGLTFKTSVNVDNTNMTYSKYVPYTVNGLLSVRNSQTTVNTSGRYQTSNYQAFVNENTLNYSTVIKKDHSLNLLIGQSSNYFNSDNSVINSSGGFTSSTIQTLNYAAGITGNTSKTKNVLISYFGRAQYSYKNKYLASGSLRTDGSSRFGSNNKYGVFPAGSLGWRVIEESFMPKIGVVSDLKLRATYGVTGNNSIGDFGSIPTTGSYGYVLGATQAAVIGQAPNRVANPDLQWEKSTTTDLGLDFGILKNRITGSFDYYSRLTNSLLLNVSIPEITGFQVYLSNAGSVRNKGFELELNTVNTVGKFQWSTRFQGSYNTNKVESLSSGQTQILLPALYTATASAILKVGQPLNSIYVVKKVGILTQQDITNKAALYGAETVGDPKYEDVDHNGIIDANDRQIVGHPNPDYTWGITNTVSYKGFDLRVLVQGQNGGSVYSLLGRAISQTGLSYIYNMSGDYRNRWRSPDNPGDGNRSKAYSTFGSIPNTDWLYSSDYFRVRDITLGYNLKKVIKLKSVASARVFVTAENYFGHDKYYGGANPESANTDLTGNGNYPQSGDYGGLPLAKVLIFGINFSF